MRRAPTRRPEWPGNEAKESEGNSSSKGSLSYSNREAASNAKTRQECIFEEKERHASILVLMCIVVHMG